MSPDPSTDGTHGKTLQGSVRSFVKPKGLTRLKETFIEFM